MSKYKVGDNLIIVEKNDEDKSELRKLASLTVQDSFAKLSWGIKIVDVLYEKPYVTLTYTNISGETLRVFAECSDVDNFDTEKVLEKALLKAFQNEIIEITTTKNSKHLLK